MIANNASESLLHFGSKTGKTLKRKGCYFEIFAHQIYESFLEYTSKIHIQRVDEAKYTHALRLVIWISMEDYRCGGGKRLGGEWKNSLDIISNFFETRGRYARLARSLTHVRRGVTVKHLAPAGAGYVTWIFVSNKICRFASAIWRTSLCLCYVTIVCARWYRSIS